MNVDDVVAGIMERQRDKLPAVLGFEWLKLESGLAEGRFDVAIRHMAPNGFLHAASVVALADTACGYGCMLSLPKGASGFTTIELKTNFIGTVREGGVRCNARLVHGGRTTQLWDAVVNNESGNKPIALFRCTQLILYPQPSL